MYKVRISSGDTKVLESFSSKIEAFDWVKKNYTKNTMFSLYQYEGGSLSVMDRFTYDGHKMVMEVIDCNWREFSISEALKSRSFKK
jgi:hypothetical protein